MIKYLCYECKNGMGECFSPCVYIDPVGEMHDADHIKCDLNDAKWVRETCDCCGQEI
jgi:hypothetical protein